MKENLCFRPLSNVGEGEIQVIKLKSKTALTTNKKGAFLLSISSSGNVNINNLYNIFLDNYSLTNYDINDFINTIMDSEFQDLLKICKERLPRKTVIQKPNNGPLRALLILTERCNFYCKHCFISATKKSTLNELTTKQWLTIIKDMSDYGFSLCFISGGEPTLRKDLSILLNEINNYNIGIKLFTNGYHIDDDLISVFKNIENFQIQIGLDSIDEDIHEYFRGPKKSFKTILNNIKIMSNEGIQVSVGTAINKYNINSMMKFPEFLSKYGTYEWVVSSLMPIGRANNNWKELFLSDEEFKLFAHNLIELNKLKNIIKISNALNDDILNDCLNNKNNHNINFTCNPFSQYIAFWPDGRLGPCDRLKEYTIGNLKERRIFELLNNNLIMEDIIKWSHSIVDECNSCDYFNICGGACPGITTNAKSIEDSNKDPIACRFLKHLCQSEGSNIIKSIYLNNKGV